MKKKKSLKKQEEEENEGAEEEEGEEGEEEEDEEKSRAAELTEDDLEKSLARLESEVTSGDRLARKDQLLAKAQQADLSKAETDELYRLLGGEAQSSERLADQITKGHQENDTMVKALDVSDYLQEQHTELTKSLEMLADHIEKADNRQHEFNLVLAKAVSDTGRLAKGMAKRLGVLEQQPARAPKAAGVQGARPIEKGFAGEQPAGETLNKSQIEGALSEMLQKSVEEGRGGATPDGIDLGVAASKFEQFGQIDPGLYQRVQQHIKAGSAS
jgi:hypothetical protein